MSGTNVLTSAHLTRAEVLLLIPRKFNRAREERLIYTLFGLP